MDKPIHIAFIGRPNVGKSSLFNALLGNRRSIVADEPGTTRDVLKERPSWANYLYLADGQGIFSEEDSAALDQLLDLADAYLFVVDVRVGVTPFDKWLMTKVKQRRKPTLLVANKSEDREEEQASIEFAQLGFEDVASVSAEHRQNLSIIENWCQKVAKEIQPDIERKALEQEVYRVALVGRPNVGKSTLINRLCRANVSRVSPIAHTTRDPVSYEVFKEGRSFQLIDTAGMRRHLNRKSAVETFSVHAAKRMIRDSDLVFLLLKCSEPIGDQDQRLMSLLEEEGKPTVILLNFWDLLTSHQRAVFRNDTKNFPLFKHYPSQPISALTGWNVPRLFSVADRMLSKAESRTPTSQLNRMVEEIVAKNPPPASGRGNFNVLYTSQVRSRPPTFIFFMNRKDALPASYENYLRNELRTRLKLKGQAIRLWFRGTEKKPVRNTRFKYKMSGKQEKKGTRSSARH